MERAYNLYSKKIIGNEIEHLIEIFIENGYEKTLLQKWIREYKNKKRDNQNIAEEATKIVTLPWIPLLSPKLRKVYKAAGYKTVFQSGPNISTLLTSKNKTKLPPNSQAGVYKLKCDCGKSYVGETGCKISTRVQQHQGTKCNGQLNQSGISEHAKNCHGQIDWDNVETLKVGPKQFPRKVREALEIQRNRTEPALKNNMNKDNVLYVTSGFWKPLMKYIAKQCQKARHRLTSSL